MSALITIKGRWFQKSATFLMAPPVPRISGSYRVWIGIDKRFDPGMPVVGVDDDRFATGGDQFEDHNIQERSALDGE
jgi:hypothetical protein